MLKFNRIITDIYFKIWMLIDKYSIILYYIKIAKEII